MWAFYSLEEKSALRVNKLLMETFWKQNGYKLETNWIQIGYTV